MYDPHRDVENADSNSQSPGEYWKSASVGTDFCKASIEHYLTEPLPPKKRKCENRALEKFYGFSSIEELVQFSFNKKYSFPKLSQSNLCLYEKSEELYLYKSEKWKVELSEFRILKEKLNDVKTRLNDYDLNEWHNHTRSTNPAGLVIRTLKNKTKQEFLTQAWCKLYELVNEFSLVPADALKLQSLCSVHLCEAPGAFVASLNHYLKTNHPTMKWRWIANSLNPYYEGNTTAQMINDDRFMLETIENWDFGPDMTGDIIHPNYPDHLKRRCGDHLPHLVTSDGSVNCQDKPEEQENSVSWLFLKETLTALNILRTGGNFVLKMFTFFECDTICLLYLLRSVFECVDVVKPVGSKEGNSEVYVICREFKGNKIELGLRDVLSASLEDHRNFAMFPYELVHSNFIANVLTCAKLFASYQMNVIERNIELFNDRNNIQFQRLSKFIQTTFTDKFVETYQVKPITLSENMVPLKNRAFKARRCNFTTEARSSKRNTHADHVSKINSNLTKEDVLHRISDELNSLGIDFWPKKTFMPEIDVNFEDFHVIRCKPIQRVMSSQFCRAAYIRMMNELMDTISIASYNDFFARNSSNFEYDCKVCDLRLIHVQSETYSEAQFLAYQKTVSVLFALENGDDVVLVNFPLLTQFSINVLCLLKQIFKEIEFRDASTLYLRGANVEECSKWKVKLEEISRLYTKERAVLSFLPLTYITGMKNPLYKWIVDINGIRAYYQILTLTDSKLKNNE